MHNLNFLSNSPTRNMEKFIKHLFFGFQHLFFNLICNFLHSDINNSILKIFIIALLLNFLRGIHLKMRHSFRRMLHIFNLKHSILRRFSSDTFSSVEILILVFPPFKTTPDRLTPTLSRALLAY